MTRFLAIGHVTRDEFEGDPLWRLGGSALYAATAAARLGAQVAMVTRIGPAERDPLEQRCRALGIELIALPSEATTAFSFRYEGARRILRVRARARAIRLADVPEDLRRADAVLLGSVAHEIDRSLFGAFAGAAVVLAAQGLLREWAADGTVHPRRWEGVADVSTHLSAVVVSDEDVAGDLAEPRRWAGTVPVMVTLAERGALVLTRDVERLVPAYAASRVVDPTGAGDAFAAGLALALAERRAVDDAVRFGNAVASFAVEGPGTAGLAGRAEVDARIAASARS